ncbi:hypothetical protein MUI08_001110 [Salmonella enterica]|nr:hypothetical protein [Salmonella enterica subsp. enterica serovar Rottnest]EJB1261912.1 hypothetical protein [Salmonella enterica]EJJ1412708.1 hypothetical protein [Salmonella enterica]EJM4590473.1 hypothetical protein [Salmonella enterica]EKO8777398.1 hypothetical protein [Salmonella enterica]
METSYRGNEISNQLSMVPQEMSIADTWTDDAFIQLMQDMLNQQKEQENDDDSDSE